MGAEGMRMGSTGSLAEWTMSSMLVDTGLAQQRWKAPWGCTPTVLRLLLLGEHSDPNSCLAYIARLRKQTRGFSLAMLPE